MNRKEFFKISAVASLASLLLPLSAYAEKLESEGKKVKVAVIGCGNVSTQYFPHISKCPYAEIVTCCDIKPDCTQKAVKQYSIPKRYKYIDNMFSGSKLDLMFILADMQVHGELNRKALMAGRNVWSEKPLANSYKEGKELYDPATSKGLHIWGASAVVNSPQLALMAEQINKGTLGNLICAYRHYGHESPSQSAFSYEPLDGGTPDLGVYNIATLTGLLGPAKSVVAMITIVTPERIVDDKGKIKVREEDNAMIIMEHEKRVPSHIECGSSYLDLYGHLGKGQEKAMISLYDSHDNMRMVGHDWAPNRVDLPTMDHPVPQRLVSDTNGYVWQEGASNISKYMALNTESCINVEHALHVLKIIEAA